MRTNTGDEVTGWTGMYSICLVNYHCPSERDRVTAAPRFSTVSSMGHGPGLGAAHEISFHRTGYASFSCSFFLLWNRDWATTLLRLKKPASPSLPPPRGLLGVRRCDFYSYQTSLSHRETGLMRMPKKTPTASKGEAKEGNAHGLHDVNLT